MRDYAGLRGTTRDFTLQFDTNVLKIAIAVGWGHGTVFASDRAVPFTQNAKTEQPHIDKIENFKTMSLPFI